MKLSIIDCTIRVNDLTSDRCQKVDPLVEETLEGESEPGSIVSDLFGGPSSVVYAVIRLHRSYHAHPGKSPEVFFTKMLCVLDSKSPVPGLISFAGGMGFRVFADCIRKFLLTPNRSQVDPVQHGAANAEVGMSVYESRHGKPAAEIQLRSCILLGISPCFCRRYSAVRTDYMTCIRSQPVARPENPVL